MGNAFPPHDNCPVPSLEAIEGSLISSCEIKDAPPPIMEFPTFDFPLPMPTSFAQGCWCFPKPSVDFEEDVEPSFAVKVTYPSGDETNCCQPLFNFFARLPAEGGMAPCVRFAPHPSLYVQYVDGSSSLWFDIWRSSSFSSWGHDGCSSSALLDECIYQFDMHLKLPVPYMPLDTYLVETNDPTVYSWCDPAAQYVSDIISLTVTPTGGPFDPYDLTLTYNVGNPWAEQFGIGDPQQGAWRDCAAKCCMSVPIVTFLTLTPGGKCASQATLDFSIDTVYLQWDQIVYTGAPVTPVCCEKFKVLLADGIDSTTGCGGRIYFNTTWVWIPHDTWTIPARDVDVLYTDPPCPVLTMYNNIEETQLIANITSSHDPECDCGNKITVVRQTVRPFPTGGLTLAVDLTTWNGLILYFEEGLLISSSDAGG